MIQNILYSALFILFAIQSLASFAFINIFLDLKVKKTIYYFTSLPFAVIGFIFNCIDKLNNYIPGIEAFIPYKSLIIIIPQILLFLFLTKGKILKKIISIIMLFTIIFALDAVSIQLYKSSIDLTDMHNIRIESYIVMNLFYSVLFVIVIILLDKIVKSKKQNYNYDFKTIFIIAILLISQYSLLVLATHTISSLTSEFSLETFAISLVNIICDIVLVRVIEQAAEKAHYEEQAKCVEEIISGEKIYYENLVEKENILAVIRHDWNEQLQVALNLCIEDNSSKTKEAEKILDELRINLIKTIPNKFSSNITINALLNSKSKILENSSINYSFNIQLSENINIDTIDLCSIFSNLINNAYEYCQNNPNNQNYISVKAKKVNNKIVIRCINQLFNPHQVEYQKTTKQDKKNHGYGIKIIESIAEKYNGGFNIHTGDNQFVASVYLLENN